MSSMQKHKNAEAATVFIETEAVDSNEAVMRLRRLAYTLVQEVELLDVGGIQPRVEIPLNTSDSLNFYEEVERFEKALIKRALRRTHGHQTEAARLLNLKKSTLYAKIKQYEIKSFAFANDLTQDSD